MSFVRHLALATTLAGLPAVVAAQNLPSAATVARVADSLAGAFMAAGGTPSVAIGVVRGGETIVMTALGTADLENDVPASAHSVYRIGSVTKQFTSAAIMQLVERDSLALSDTLGELLGGLPEAWRPVTVRQLLNHTSGIHSYTALAESWRKRWGSQMTPDSIIALVFDSPMDFAPGTKWNYNNTGYVLLGMIIEKVTGTPWGEDLERRLLGPIGLSDTHDCLDAPVIPRRVRGYEREDGHWENTAYLAMTHPLSAGAMCSTVLDLAKWNQALHGGKVVSAESYTMMTTPEGAATETGYGFGLGRGAIEGHTMIMHGGGINGFRSSNAWFPDAELSVSVIINSGAANPGSLMMTLARAALGLPLEAAADSEGN
jgi:D-alanyl-D-alanine carboxypeptidase